MNNGEIVELAIRRNSVSISELSRRLRVSRRSVYNWFGQKDLSFDIICKIGEALKYDFSSDFPDKFNGIKNKPLRHIYPEQDIDNYPESANYWKNKYISLLEKYNNLEERKSVTY